MGPTLEETRRDLRYMPTQYLTQVAQSPVDRVIGDIPLKTLAGLELSRRAQMQSEMAGMNAPNAQMPTVLDSTVQSLMPQPQQPMPPQGMAPPPPPQQAAPQPQPQPQQPPQPQQQQQPPQAKQPPIMGLPAMQGPKKMAGGGIIAFAEGSKEPIPSQYAGWENLVLGSDKEQPENKDFNPLVDPRAYPRPPKEEKKVPPAVKADAKKPDEKPPIKNVADPTSGLAALMQGMGGGRGGGGGGLSKEDNELRQRILKGEPMGPAQTAYMQDVNRLAPQLESSRPPVLSDAEASAIEDRQFGKYQTRSKPHFDMMQKLIDEERAANNAGKESEVYKTLGKMGGALMSSRGAFGPALGHAVGEGIDYNDKMDAARAAAERLRRQAQMDLVKARMADEKDDQKSAQAYVAEHDRKIRDAYKIEQEGKIAAMTMRGKAAEFEAGDERGRERAITALALSDAKRAVDLARTAGAQENNMLRMQMGLMGLQQKREVAPLEKMKIKAAINEMFSNPFNDPDAISYIQAVKGNRGANLLAKIKSGELSPKDAMLDPVMAEARQIAYSDFLSGTSKGGGGSGVQSYDSYVANLPK